MEEGGSPEINVVWIAFVVVAGVAAIVAAFVVTYVIVSAIVLGLVRLLRGPNDPEVD